MWGYEFGPVNPQDTAEGVNRLSFDTEDGNPRLIYEPKSNLDFLTYGCMISDAKGKYLFSWDGLTAEDFQYNLIKDWQKICPDNDCKDMTQGSFLLPDFLDSNYILVYMQDTIFGDTITYFNFHNLSSIKFAKNNAGIKLISNKKIILKDSLLDFGKLTACRHANGRDWWIIAPSDSSNIFYNILFTPNGMQYHSSSSTGENKILGLGFSCFSPDGNYYCISSGKDHIDSLGGFIYFYHFDRCTGQLSNQQISFTDTLPKAFTYGVCFSPDSRFLYMCSALALYQYPIVNGRLGTRVEIARYDGFRSNIFGNVSSPTYFGQINHGPDGRLYVNGEGFPKRHIHTIHRPNEQGLACDFRQHDFPLYSNLANFPHFPHYRLGPVDGSVCDSLGISNIPWCHWRYNQDSSRSLKIHFTDLSAYQVEEWMWDFGDGNTSVAQHPVHNYQKQGTYKVCLIAKNKNGADTLCRILQLGVNQSQHHNKSTIKLYPNPTSDLIVLDLKQFLPIDATIRFYSVLGELVHEQKLKSGQQEINLSSMSAGHYFYMIRDQQIVISHGKIVKL
ncbi:MAG: T9SS type A sorting domain-containing protein [Saprospiraceae bacterium]|nr:T9SS type A sorting domain-containing protein [Saprospiraceae bacterium]